MVRTVIGGLFIGHGAQKLFGWFGGHGPEGTGQFFENVGVRPGRRNAIAAGAAEAVGGSLLVAGLLTPVAGAALSSVMITAIRHVHSGKGPWVTEGGYEYNLVLIAALLAVAAVALVLSSMTDSPLAAALGSIAFVVTSQVLDLLDAAASVRPYLPTRYWLAFVDLFRTPILWHDVQRGFLLQGAYVVVLLGLAWANFASKDVTS